jgi:virginiamycin A acetyltransferase
MGAFSYAVNGYYFGASIGRYSSIGEAVQIGRGSHPTRWASSSPVFYQNYQAALDLANPEADRYLTSAPYHHPKPTVIGNDVYIGHGAFLAQGVCIGDGAIVGAQSVVTKDVPPFAVVAGSPAYIRSFRFDELLVERFLNLRWWRFAFWDLEGATVEDPVAFLDRVEELEKQGLNEYTPDLVHLNDMRCSEHDGASNIV